MEKIKLRKWLWCLNLLLSVLDFFYQVCYLAQIMECHLVQVNQKMKFDVVSHKFSYLYIKIDTRSINKKSNVPVLDY